MSDPIITLPIKGTYNLDYLTQCRLIGEQFILLTVRLLPVAFALMFALQVRATWPDVEATISGFLRTAVRAPFMWTTSMVVMAFVLTAVNRALSSAPGNMHFVEIGQPGVRTGHAGREFFVPWRSLTEVRLFPRSIFLRSDRWIQIPAIAFATENEFQAARTLCRARGRLDIPGGNSPVMVDRIEPPERGEQVLVRVSIPPERTSFTSIVAKTVRHSPMTTLPLAVAAIPALVLNPNHLIGVSVAVGAPIVILYMANTTRRKALAGRNEVVDLTEDGIENWKATFQTSCSWDDIRRVSEDSDGFLMVTRTSQLNFFPHDCIEDGARERMREVLKTHLGDRARLLG